MDTFEEIDVNKAKELMADKNCVVVDIRLKDDYEHTCIAGAVNIGDDNIEEFIQNTDKSKTVVCYCYRGMSSQNAAQYFLDQGFSRVYSLAGGFEAWRQSSV